MRNERQIETLRDCPPGEDTDEYEDRDLNELPDWWKYAVEEHEAYDLRPYRPPRFEDDVLVPPLLETLEDRYGSSIQLFGINNRYGDDWVVYIDGESAFEIPRRRDPAGYTVFEHSSTKFEETIRSALSDDTGTDSNQ